MTARAKKILIASLCVLLAVLFFFPQIASRGFGKKMAVKAFEKKFHGTIEIDSLSLSWLGPQKIRGLKFSREDLEGSLDVLETPAPLWSISSQFKGPFLIQGGSAIFLKSYRIEQINGQILNQDFNLSGITLQGGQKGSFSAQGKVLSEKDFDVNLNVAGFPTAILDSFLNAKGTLAEFLGTSFNLTGRVANPGPVQLDLISTNGKANLKGRLIDNTLTLTDALNASFILTPETGKKSPLRSIPSVASKNPILFKIFPQGFTCPLFPFSIETLQIGDGLLDLGQTTCLVDRPFISIFNLLNTPLNSREIDIWFTPVSFSLKQGRLRIGRMDALLAYSIHICAWGSINLLNNRLDLFLGLPADALRKAFGIKNLSDSFVLKVPISGTIQEPEIEKGAAAAKIAAMAASQKIPKKGEIFGGLVNQFIQVQEEKGVPPPNRPFPWER